MKVGDLVQLIKTNKDPHTGFKTIKGSKGVVDFIPTWRKDVVQVLFEGVKSPTLVFVSDLIQITSHDPIQSN